MVARASLRRVRPYVYISITPSRSKLMLNAVCARSVCHRVKDLALVVTLPASQGYNKPSRRRAIAIAATLYPSYLLLIPVYLIASPYLLTSLSLSPVSALHACTAPQRTRATMSH